MAINLFEKYWYDAMANLGQSLGQRSADNAARRQGIKSRNAIDEMLENSQRQQQIEEIANMNQPQAQEAAKEPQKAVSVTGNIPGLDLRGRAGDPTLGLSKATPNGRSVQENAVDEVLGLKVGGQYPIGKQEVGAQLEKLGQNPVNTNAAAVQDVAAATDPRMVKLGQEASGLSPQKAKLGWVNVTADDVRNDLRKRGIDEDIIDKELVYFKDQIKTRARDQFLPEIMDGLYGYTNKEGEYVAPSLESYRNANEKLMLLKQYDPETANPLLSGSITPRDIYNQNRADTVYGRTRQDLLTDRAEARSNKKQDVQESFALKRDAEKQQFLDQVQLFMEVYDVDYKTAAKLALGGSGTGRGKGGSGLPGSVSTQQMNAAKEEIKAFDNWREMNPDVDVKTYPRYNQVNYAYQINDAALGYGGSSGGNGNAVEEIDWNNYNHDIRAAQQLKEEGYSDKDISTILLQNMGAGDLYNNVVKDRNLPNLANTQKNDTDAAIAAIAAQSSKGMFDDQDNERAGLVKALSDGLTVKQYLDNKYGNK